jgi:hypothetical protein
VPVDFRVGDVLRLRKPHPCGGYDWTVVRIGADIGLRCTTCNRRVMLPRTEVERRMRSFVSRAEHTEPFGSAEAAESLVSPPTGDH